MTKYAGFAHNCPANDRRRSKAIKEQEEAVRESGERASHVRRAQAMAAVANVIIEQNEKMLAGLRASQRVSPQQLDQPVDFVARNITRVGPSRSSIGAREQRLMARAEVLAAATEHLDGRPPMDRARPVYSSNQGSTQDSAIALDLVRAARAEVERGISMSEQEARTRRAPPRLTGLGRSCTF